MKYLKTQSEPTQKRGSSGETASEHGLAGKGPKKAATSIPVILIIWLMAVVSLLGIHYVLNKRPQIKINRAGLMKIHAKFNTLNDEEKAKIKYFESGIIELATGELYVVDSGFEAASRNSPAQSGLAGKRIEFPVDDPLFLERKMMVGEAQKTLNNAERRCLIDGHAAIIFENGAYYLILDSKIYADYVAKYGTECPSCGKKTKQPINKSQ